MIFRNKQRSQFATDSQRLPEFGYLSDNDIYLDSACQSIRPQPVIDAINEYYHTYNACGERVKYDWGKKVDEKLEETRESVIRYMGLSKKKYTCSFTQNTTYGINLILAQLKKGNFKRVVTSEIEHNSVFLPTINLAKRLKIERLVLNRKTDGSLIYDDKDIKNAIVVVNATSNIDGRILKNIKTLVDDVHKNNGIIIIDAAQTMAHYHDLMIGVQADAFCFSAHKLYAASLGCIVAKKEFIQHNLENIFIGGGMVSEVKKDSFELLPEEEIHTRLEPGLQSYDAIISLGAAIKWLEKVKINGLKPSVYVEKLGQKLYDGVKDIPNIHMLNNQASSVISFYHPKIDSHRLAIFLSSANIMTRSGYFCCHYYLNEKMKLPSILRLSIGLHNTENDIEKTIETIKKIIGDK